MVPGVSLMLTLTPMPTEAPTLVRAKASTARSAGWPGDGHGSRFLDCLFWSYYMTVLLYYYIVILSYYVIIESYSIIIKRMFC